MTPEEMSTFKGMFRKYCLEELNEGRCTDDDCEWCPIDSAYEKIFRNKIEEDEAEDDE